MLRRTTKIQLALFLLITLTGVSYVSANYVGLFKGFFSGGSCTVYANFPDSGGIFSNAEVTYRGVAIGRVGSLTLLKNGVQVAMDIDNCTSAKIPNDTTAAVSDRSVIGEQYVNLIPPDGKPPYLAGGETIPMSRTSIPLSAEALLSNMDSLITSVNLQSLRTTVSELGKAFANRGPDLGSLLDSQRDLLSAAQQNLPQTLALIEQSSGVLQTQLDLRDPIASWAHNLNLLSGQLKKSDPDIRRLLDTGPSSLGVVRKFVLDNRTDLGATLANLATLGTIMVRHRDGIEEVFELYPALAAGGQSVIRSNRTAELGLVTQNTPRDCGDPKKGSEGYQGTILRSPSDLSPAAPNVGAHCSAPQSSGVNVRGAQNVPGGDPLSASGGGVAYPRGTTNNTVQLSTRLNQAGILGDKAWVAYLTSALH
ncbi:MAG TPA: MCE family protein [Jatrophihabitans sp.]|jgi:phospholipid/cholesterol/gamma-HCH transport system substrate-binding protein